MGTQRVSGAPSSAAERTGMMTTEKHDTPPIEKLANQGRERLEQMFQDYKTFEAQQQEKAVEMIDEGVKMMKANMEYGLKISEEWRRLALKTNRQVAELFTTRWF